MSAPLAAAEARPLGGWRGQLAECPRWDADTQRLSWVDIPSGLVCSCSATGEALRVIRLPPPVGAAIPLPGGCWLVCRGHAVGWLDAAGAWTHWQELPDGAGLRLNDAGLDPVGRFWVGSLSLDFAPGRGRLWSLQDSRPPQVHREGLGIANGLAWDGRWMWLVDSMNRTITRCTWTPEGRLGDPEPWYRVQDGMPDGICLDRAGCLWVACFWGGCVLRLGPEGELLARVDLPVSGVTACWIGGPQGNILFITSAADHGSGPLSRRPDWAGRVLALPLSQALAR